MKRLSRDIAVQCPVRQCRPGGGLPFGECKHSPIGQRGRCPACRPGGVCVCPNGVPYWRAFVGRGNIEFDRFRVPQGARQPEGWRNRAAPWGRVTFRRMQASPIGQRDAARGCRRAGRGVGVVGSSRVWVMWGCQCKSREGVRTCVAGGACHLKRGGHAIFFEIRFRPLALENGLLLAVHLQR